MQEQKPSKAPAPKAQEKKKEQPSEDEEEFYTLKNCKKIFDALNPLYKMAKELVVEMILEDPTILDD